MAAIPQSTILPKAIGLIAGNGLFPQLFARAAQARGVEVVAVAMRGETLEGIEGVVDHLTWVRVGQLGRTIKIFKQAGIRQAAMAGGVRKTRLFSGARPDLTAIRLLARCAVRRDDGMLRAVAGEFERHGIEIVDSTIYMPDALAPCGVLTDRGPTEREQADLDYGLHIAMEIGRLDIGQAVVIKDGAVVALEAIEGTDACIARAGELTQHRGAVVVKGAKPLQDMRFDVPAIGVKTVDSLARAGIRVLGIEAGRTLMIEPEKIITEANRQGIVLVGLANAGSEGK